MDAGDHGWISLDETLAAGERLVLDNAFFTDFFGEVKDTNNVFAIGLKGENWSNTKEVSSNGAAATGLTFKGNTYIVGIWNSSGNSVTMWICANGVLTNSMYLNTSSLWNSACAFLEITGSGNNIRAGMGRNGSNGVTAGSESTTTYGNWNSYKGQTGEQGFGISSLDVMMSFWTFNGGAIDGDEIDWTGLTEISIPAAVNIDTDFNKAIDFSGGSEHLSQTNNHQNVNPFAMSNLGVSVPHNSNTAKTSANSNSRPWAITTIFQSGRHSSNQHIWNYGEGSGSNDDNIYLRQDASGNIYFGWGRSGGLNECKIYTIANSQTSDWFGVYIGHTGYRSTLGTASNLALAFDIYIMTSDNGDNFTTLGSNKSTSTNWTAGSTGGNMTRAFDSSSVLTIGGRASNRNFHGKVASAVVTTLRTNQLMPIEAEIKLMITDPVKWTTDYKVGNAYRRPYTNSDNSTVFAVGPYGSSTSAYSTQVWLMGDGTSDNYSNGVRNYVYPGDQNYTKLQFNSMASNDIETVTIPGLT